MWWWPPFFLARPSRLEKFVWLRRRVDFRLAMLVETGFGNGSSKWAGNFPNWPCAVKCSPQKKICFQKVTLCPVDGWVDRWRGAGTGGGTAVQENEFLLKLLKTMYINKLQSLLN